MGKGAGECQERTPMNLHTAPMPVVGELTDGQQMTLDALVYNTEAGEEWTSSWQFAQQLQLKNADTAARYLGALVKKGLVEVEKRRAPELNQWKNKISTQSFWKLSSLGRQYCAIDSKEVQTEAVSAIWQD